MLFLGAQACVLAFSTVDRDSFEAISKWKTKVRINDKYLRQTTAIIFCLTLCTVNFDEL